MLNPIKHDSANEIAQPFDPRDWKKGECEPIPGKTMPTVTVVERDYPHIYERFTAIGPLMDSIGNGIKGMAWKTGHEVQHLKELNGVHTDGANKGLAKIVTDIDATEMILMMAPETNGEVAVKAWDALGKATGREHTHLALPKEDEKIRFRMSCPSRVRSSRRRRGPAGEREGLLQRRLHQRA